MSNKSRKETPTGSKYDVSHLKRDDMCNGTDTKGAESMSHDKQRNINIKPLVLERLFNRRPKTENKLKMESAVDRESVNKDNIKSANIGKKFQNKNLEHNDQSIRNGSGIEVTISAPDENVLPENSAEVRLRAFHYWKWIILGILIVFLAIIIVVIRVLFTSSKPQPFQKTANPLTITECGQIQGLFQDGVYIFRGIPYALPPIGEHRWKPPQPIAAIENCWNGIYMAHNMSKSCYQKWSSVSHQNFSEDCLYLNVYTPSLSHHQLRPVIVYIPGYSLEGSYEDLEWQPNPILTKEKDVLLVTFNYRLSVFGFMALKVLSDTVRPPTSGNYGFYDQIAALKWVKRNIIHFGGDAKRVTVLAHGSGATGAVYLLSSLKSQNLFSQMWITGPAAQFPNKTLQQVQLENLHLLRNLNCDTRKCLLNKTPEELLNALPDSWSAGHLTDLPSTMDHSFSPIAVIDGVLVYDDPFTMWTEGTINDVPIVIGSAAQEIGLWSGDREYLNTWTWEDFTVYVRQKLDTVDTNLTNAVLDYYVRNSSTPKMQFYTMVSDVRAVCPIQHLTKKASDQLESSVYSYIIDYISSKAIKIANKTLPQVAFSGLDIIAIFDLLHKYIPEPTDADIKFHRIIQELFYTFVHTGKPFLGYSPLKKAAYINFIGESVNEKMAPYENCHVWENFLMFGKIN
ncbi:neurotactin-like [Tachypleus tridentatus]|uniref:neurotactin-like n=1 Tax=Tachypleus tridentatus TaxID=6853 RepID=UPI003FD220CE